MERVRIEVGAGRLLARAVERGIVDALVAPVERAARELRVLAEPTGGLWLKGDHLPGKARWRHSVRHALGIPAPRELELDALRWLRQRLFRAPRPLASGVLIRGAVLRYQFLALELIEGHESLESALASSSEPARSTWLDELARELARLHALHFVHRNLFLRNVLVSRSPQPPSGDARRLTFIDVWRGGAARPRRGADYDLACLFLEGAELLSEDEQRRLVALYLREREHQGNAVAASPFLAGVDARRGELLARIRADPRRWHRATPPQAGWSACALSP